MKSTFTIILLFCCFQAAAQDSLQYFNQQRYHITTTGMTVLGSWAVANIAVGGIGWANTNGAKKYFYQMDTYWGAVNLGAAILGYTGAQKIRNKTLTAAESLKEQTKMETIFLVNGGLDIVYVGVGGYLYHRGNSNDDQQLKGYGASIIMQGAFLLLFDATMYSTNRSNGNKLRHFLEKNPVTFDGKKVGMLIHL